MWHLGGKEFPARPGDVIYAASGTMHSITNTGDVPLTYYMLKWDAKGGRIEIPPEIGPAVESQPPSD
jgi:mannose-6-phosphate isomerase-like protein (cupin superfamily)